MQKIFCYAKYSIIHNKDYVIATEAILAGLAWDRVTDFIKTQPDSRFGSGHIDANSSYYESG